MNYVEFKAYLTEHLWRTGDDEFASAIDEIIKTAENRLNRDTRDDRDLVSTTELLAVHPWPLPADLRSIHALNVLNPAGSNANGRGMPSTYRSFRSLSEFQNNNTAIFLAQPFGKYYTTLNNHLYLSGHADLTNGIHINLVYYNKIPHFADLPPDQDHPFRMEQRDVYLEAVTVSTYEWLRDYESGQVSEGKYKDLLASYREDAAIRKYNGAPLDVRLPGIVR